MFTSKGRAEELKRNIETVNDNIQQLRNQLTLGGPNSHRVRVWLRNNIEVRQRIRADLLHLNMQRSIMNEELHNLVLLRNNE